MFEQATKNKYRFPSTVGLLNVEDLWDLSIERLDKIYKTLKSELKQVEEESLLNTVTDVDKEVQNKIEIVKHIFNVKLDEREAKIQSKEKAERKQYLLSILKQKQNAEFESKSVDELRQLIDNL